jgi:hypothetical protein
LRIGCRGEYLGLSGASKKGELRKLHNEELNVPYYATNYYSGDKIEKNEMGRACSAYGR